jgi:hypothetical protein
MGSFKNVSLRWLTGTIAIGVPGRATARNVVSEFIYLNLIALNQILKIMHGETFKNGETTSRRTDVTMQT